MMKRIYLSHPYNHKDENRVKAERLTEIYNRLWKDEGKDMEIVNPLEYFKAFDDLPDDTVLRMAVNLMCTCDGVLFAPGWKRSRGCRYEHWIARHKDCLPIHFRQYEISEAAMA